MNDNIVVVDASVAIKWVLKEPLSEEALLALKQWSDKQTKIISPCLLMFEVANAIYKRFVRKELTIEQAKQRVELFNSFAPALDFGFKDQVRVLDLAQKLNRPSTYDLYYLVLAEKNECEFWTADEKLWNAVKSSLAWVKWIGDLNSP